MGITKTTGFQPQTLRVADMLKALGHPARLSIFSYLVETNACVGSEIVEHIPLSQPTISRHLAEMKSAGLIKGTVSGKNMSYCIDEQGLELLRSVLEGMSVKVANNKKCC